MLFNEARLIRCLIDKAAPYEITDEDRDVLTRWVDNAENIIGGDDQPWSDKAERLVEEYTIDQSDLDEYAESSEAVVLELQEVNNER